MARHTLAHQGMLAVANLKRLHRPAILNRRKELSEDIIQA